MGLTLVNIHFVSPTCDIKLKLFTEFFGSFLDKTAKKLSNKATYLQF